MSEKILIVDDQAVMLRLISHPLEQEGYTIVTAMTGVDALQQIQTEQPDLIILDVMLPDASGIDICRRVRQVLNRTDLPIIILSGQTELAAKIQGLEAGADEYVTKPVDPKEMVVRVRALLARTQRLRQVVVTPTGQKTRQGRIVAVIGAKGGVGVTTAVANIATGLAMRNQSTIAVELRPYFGTLARHLGLTPTASLSNLLELIPKSITDVQISARLLPAHHGLRVLVGPQQLKDYREAQVDHIEVSAQYDGAYDRLCGGRSPPHAVDCQPDCAAHGPYHSAGTRTRKQLRNRGPVLDRTAAGLEYNASRRQVRRGQSYANGASVGHVRD